MRSATLLKRLATISGWTLVSRVLGLIRDRLLGASFGASLLLDAFFVAFALPNMLRNMFGEGALSAAFIPRYAQLCEQNREEADAFAGLVIARLAVFLSGIAAIGMLAAGILMLLDISEKVTLVAVLAFAQLPYLVFVCVSAILAGVLNARQHFAVPAAAPLILNICMIAAVLVWENVYVLPYAVFTTGLLQLALHLLALKKLGGIPRSSLRGTDVFYEMRKALLPTVIASGVYQANALLDAIIAYEFLENATGAVVILYFANRLLQFPLALIAHGVGTAAYPEMSRVAVDGYATSGQFLARVNRVLLALVLPATAGLLLVAEPLARCIYQAGAFQAESVVRVVAVTQIYACGLLPMAMGKLLVRCLHAHRDQRTPMRIALSGVVINLTLNMSFIYWTDWDECGLALASILSSACIMLSYVLVLHRRGANAVIMWLPLGQSLLATVLMAAAVFAFLQFWAAPSTAGSLADWLRLVAAALIGALIYGLVMLRLLRRWKNTLSSNKD